MTVDPTTALLRKAWQMRAWAFVWAMKSVEYAHNHIYDILWQFATAKCNQLKICDYSFDFAFIGRIINDFSFNCFISRIVVISIGFGKKEKNILQSFSFDKTNGSKQQFRSIEIEKLKSEENRHRNLIEKRNK